MKNLFRYFKTSPEIIRLAVMMYVRFPLSLRQVEDLLHESGNRTFRSTTISTRNVIFIAAGTSNSTDRPPLPNGVKLPPELGAIWFYMLCFFYSDKAKPGAEGKAKSARCLTRSQSGHNQKSTDVFRDILKNATFNF